MSSLRPFRIGWYVHHRGAGHRMTAGSVIPLLDAEVTVFTSAAGEVAAPHARTVHLPLDTVEPTRQAGEPGREPGRQPGPAPGREPGGGRTAHGRLHWAPTDSPGHPERLATIAAWVAETRPQLFVVDVSAEIAAFVRLLGVPVVSFTLPGLRDDPAHRLAYELSDAVVAPWPELLGPPAASVPAGRLHRVGALSRFAPAPADAPVRALPAEVLVLHGAGGRGADPLDAAAAGLEAAGHPVRHLRDAGADEVWAALRAAPLVLSHCGSNAVAEIAAARRPAILIPDARPHAEQDHLAEALTRAPLPCLVVAPADVARTDWAAAHRAAAALDGSTWQHWNDGAAATRIAALLHDLAAPAAVATPPAAAEPEPAAGAVGPVTAEPRPAAAESQPAAAAPQPAGAAA
ncbi:hypothetical protein NVV95_05735 [Herbiconiux sp. CPCC 205716]|uniref:Glycosyl transferase family 28 C-terminal domain-containing protein n=1 Tax=Herbiconiux gentiana TaxID=2970912 RepID=A0ABT2GCY4_9MICO|nr:glycosyltransferase [Herbiconiux gentiana]MCS5714050.1 hypothetical protein [Herbiconiux gentiana]